MLLGTSYQDFDGRSILSWQFEKDPATSDFWSLQAALDCEIGLRDSSDDEHIIRWTLARKLVAVQLKGGGNAVRYPVN